MTIVVLMFSAFAKNDLLLSMMATVAGDDVEVEPARKAFAFTKGDFRAKFAAAVQAQLAQSATPEMFIDLPDNPDQLRSADLERLVRPAPHGFLRSHPSKGELLGQVAMIRRRQQQRPAWIPRIDRDGRPLSSAVPDATGDEREPDRPLLVVVLPELGEITVQVLEAGWERPELIMAPGGIGEWETALHTVLGLTCGEAPAGTITLDPAANEALVPAESRWWSPEPSEPVPAAQDPGVASELLATSATLSALPVAEATLEVYESVIEALLSAGDWRYSPRWLLEPWDPAGGAATLTTARAAIAGWADEDRSGVIAYVFGGALHPDEGLIGAPSPLHSYLLVATRSVDGGDDIHGLHRVILSCPGEHWCHRGGCPDVDRTEIGALLTPIVAAAQAAEASDHDDPWQESYRLLYGDGFGHEETDRVLDQLSMILMRAGWAELQQSTWEGGMEQILLRREEHCLSASYDPVTRQIHLADGTAELDLVMQMLAEEGVLIEDDGRERIDTTGTSAEGWEAGLLAAADAQLRGRITELRRPGLPAQFTVLGLHPRADGALRGPQAALHAERQLGALLRPVGLLAPPAQ